MQLRDVYFYIFMIPPVQQRYIQYQLLTVLCLGVTQFRGNCTNCVIPSIFKQISSQTTADNDIIFVRHISRHKM